MPDQISFGIGCFHFGYDRQPPYEFSTKSYVEEIRSALGALSSVSRIEIDFDESLHEVLTIDEGVVDLEDGEVFPGMGFLEVKFSVYIPARLQAEILPNEGLLLRTETENFSVVMSHKFHGPISYVECIDAGATCHPSDAVRLLARYLEREFSKLSSPVRFQSIGPSPFHANFYARQSDEPQDSLTVEEIKQHGYNDFVFTYGLNVSPDEAMDLVYYELSHELDCFYDIQRASVKLMRSGYSLLSAWEDLRERAEAPRKSWNLRRRFQLHADVQKLISNLYGFQANLAVERTRLRQEVGALYSKGTDTYLESFVRQKLDRIPDYPVESILKWAEHMEGNAFKQAEIAAIVLSALAGGLVGSVFTALLSFGQS